MLDDKDLYTLLMQNPEKGLGKVMDKYMRFVYSIVYGKLSGIAGKPDIEECVSDVFHELYRSRASIDWEKGSLKSYLAVISKRKAIDAYRKIQAKPEAFSLNEYESDIFPSNADVEKSVIDSEMSDILIREIRALGEPDSSILIRKYYFDESSKTIARALHLKENTVNKKVSRALAKLKKSLGGIL